MTHVSHVITQISEHKDYHIHTGLLLVDTQQHTHRSLHDLRHASTGHAVRTVMGWLRSAGPLHSQCRTSLTSLLQRHLIITKDLILESRGIRNELLNI